MSPTSATSWVDWQNLSSCFHYIIHAELTIRFPWTILVWVQGFLLWTCCQGKGQDPPMSNSFIKAGWGYQIRDTLREKSCVIGQFTQGRKGQSYDVTWDNAALVLVCSGSSTTSSFKKTSFRSPPASAWGGVLTQEHLNFSFQLLWCRHANGLHHRYGNCIFESPHTLCPTCVQLWKDTQMLLSTSSILRPGKVKVLNWEHGENKRAGGPGRTSQTRELLRLQEIGPLSTRSTPIRLNLFSFITLSQAAVSLPSPLICLSLSVFLTSSSFLRFRMHNLRELAQ